VGESFRLIEIYAGSGAAVSKRRAAIAWAGARERSHETGDGIHAAHVVRGEIGYVKVALVVERSSLEVVERGVGDVASITGVAGGSGSVTGYDAAAERDATDLVGLGVAKSETLHGGIDRHL